MPRPLLGLFVTTLSIAPATAQLQWLRPDGPLQLTARYGVQIANDPTRARVVLFGGRDYSRHFDETWEWDGSAWLERFPATRPPSRSHCGLAYDWNRGRVVLFGGAGAGGTLFGDLWEWDGTNWSQPPVTAGPSPRSAVAMTHDVARARTIVFGGTVAGGVVATDPHWEWDGTNWTTGPAGPAARTGACLAHDWVRARTVLFGGGGTCFGFTCPTFGDTWEWNGTTWTQRATTGPPTRLAGAMTFDPVRNRVLLVGGQGGCQPACTTTFNDAWEWDGALWSLRSAQGPRAHSGGLAYDMARGTAVAFGGISGDPFVANHPANHTRGFDGTNWTLLAAPPMPAGLAMQELAYDAARARVVYFGNGVTGNPGRAETWEWSGQSWLQRTPATSPPARYDHAMSYDSIRQRLVLFGGTAPSGSFLNDTWEWDGNTWLQRPTATSPPSQYVHAMAFDAGRAVTVLFPGAFGGSTLFEYDGVTWTPRPTAVTPPYRLNASLAYDQRRARTVLFGGHGNVFFDDCWEWDGTQWAAMSPAQRPPARTTAGLVYDEVRQRIVLFGGASATWAPLGDVWEWDGTNWTPRTFGLGPPPRHAPGLAYDAARGRIVVFGGHGGPGGGGMQDTWELLTPCDRAGPGEVAGGGLPCGCATPPKLGTTFCVSYSNPNTAGVQFLLLAVGTCSSPALVVLPPAACAPSFVYPAPMATLATIGNPATFCMQLPGNPAFLGTPFCVQGASLETTNCLRATDGLIVVTQ